MKSQSEAESLNSNIMQRISHKNEALNTEIDPVTEAFKSLDEIIDDIQKYPNGIDELRRRK